MLCVEPRSIWIHCGSLAALAQRVPPLPSTARLGVVPAFSLDEEVAVLFSAILVVPQPAATVDAGVLVAGADVLVLVGVMVGPTGVFVRVAVAAAVVLVAVFVAPLLVTLPSTPKCEYLSPAPRSVPFMRM